MEQKIFQRIDDIEPVVNAHGQGAKYVFLKNEDSNSPLTQFAYGKLMPGELCAMHVHPTMEECFYFLKGIGEYIINNVSYPLEPGCFLRIPAGQPHQLEATGTENLEFVYFGIATN